MSKPKPCPFCGGKNVEVRPNQEGRGSGDIPWIAVVCDDCDIAGETCTSNMEAIEAWNTRATPTDAGTSCPICGGPADIVTEVVPYKWGKWPEVAVPQKCYRCKGKCEDTLEVDWANEAHRLAMIEILEVHAVSRAPTDAGLREAIAKIREVAEDQSFRSAASQMDEIEEILAALSQGGGE